MEGSSRREISHSILERVSKHLRVFATSVLGRGRPYE